MTSAAELVHGLRRRGLTLATAESLTGGGLGAALTGVAGSSAVYAGGVVSYATRVKTDLLGVDAGVVDRAGAVSSECARAMASRARVVVGADVALSTTGVAGPEAQEAKPVGTVFVAVADAHGEEHRELRLTGDRDSIRAQTVEAALRLALLRLGVG